MYIYYCNFNFINKCINILNEYELRNVIISLKYEKIDIRNDILSELWSVK